MRGVSFEFAGQKIARDDAAGFAVDHHHVHHFVAVVHIYIAESDLSG